METIRQETSRLYRIHSDREHAPHLLLSPLSVPEEDFQYRVFELLWSQPESGGNRIRIKDLQTIIEW